MFKRRFDIFASFFGLLVLSPVIALVAWEIRKNLGSPVLSKQVRLGKGGKPFELVDRRSGDIAVCYSNPSKALADLGWQAQLGLERMVTGVNRL